MTAPETLSPSHWQARAAAHEARVGEFVDAFLARRSRGQKHPVHDFLFTYYSFSPFKAKAVGALRG